jgi:hypothetical protein
LKELVQNNDLRAAASALGERIRAEEGVGKAVSLIQEKYVQRAGLPSAGH